MAEKFTVEMGDEHYRIIGPEGEEGSMVVYGDTSFLAIEEAIY
jgi:hypothetical protein